MSQPTPSTPRKPFTRVLLKLSGEMFGGKSAAVFEQQAVEQLAEQLAEVYRLNIAVGVVVGGGNIFRAREAPPNLDRVSGDYIGMLGTMINAIFLQDILEKKQISTRVMSALEIRSLSEFYIKRRAERHFQKKRLVIFAAGTGHPFFTTDTAAALRASEMRAEVLIKCTKVDGIYDKDPHLYPDAVRYPHLKFQEAINQELKIMDSTAMAFCKDNHIPILVIDIGKPGSLLKAVQGEEIGTLLH